MSKKKNCFCSYCRNQRTYLARKHIGFFDIFFLLIPTVLLSFIFWQKLDPRALLFWVFLSFSFEIFAILRWRIAIICKYCGFDPVLYLKSPEKAAEKVKAFMEERKQSANFLLSVKQYENLPRRKIQKSIDSNKSQSANT